MKVLLTILSLTLSALSFGQSDSIFRKDLVSILELTLEKSQVFEVYSEPQEIRGLTPVFKFNTTDTLSMVNSDASEYYNLKSKIERKDIGLDARMGYLENLAGGVFDDENFLYNRRFLVGVHWDVLKDGYYQHRNNAEISKIQGQISSLESDNDDRKKFAYRDAYNNIIYNFNDAKIDVLNDKKQLVDSLLDVYYKLYYLKYIPWDDVLKVINSKATAEQLISGFQSYNENFSSFQSYEFDAENLPVLNFRIDSLHKINDDFSKLFLDSIAYLQGRILDLKNDPLKDISLTPYLRYNNYQGGSLDDSRNFVSAGVNLSFPIIFQYKRKLELTQLEKQMLSDNRTEFHQLEVQEVNNLNYEYQYKLKQYVDLIYKQRIRQELLRKEVAKKNIQDDDYSPIAILKLIDELMAVKLEIIDLKQGLYLNLLKIFYEAELDQVEDISTVFEYDRSYKDYSATKAMYLWSKDFTTYDNNFIIEYCKANRINKLIISTGSQSELKEKMEQLMKTAANEIAIYQMFGSNELVRGTKEEWKSYFEKNFVEACNGLHIDVEPHTEADWDSNRAELTESYLEMIATFQSLLDEKKLEVSIPLHYEESLLEGIYQTVDAVYLMAYENVKIDYINRKIAEELALGREKTCLAFRPSDFANRYEFEMFLLRIQYTTGVYNSAIHDMTDLIELDDLVIKSKNN